MKLNIYHVTIVSRKNLRFTALKVPYIRTSKHGLKCPNIGCYSYFRVLCKFFLKSSPILTMFFLYTIVSYMIYLQLQILCILPLNPTLIKQYLYLCSKIWKINHLLEIENQLVVMRVEAHYHYHQRWYNKIDTVELVSIIITHQVPN